MHDLINKILESIEKFVVVVVGLESGIIFRPQLYSICICLHIGNAEFANNLVE